MNRKAFASRLYGYKLRNGSLDLSSQKKHYRPAKMRELLTLQRFTRNLALMA